jgi:hypothetical protein
MSQTATQPRAGYGTRQDRRVTWFNVNKGKFKFKPGAGEEVPTDDKGYLYCDFVFGVYAGHKIRWKDGTGDVRGHEVLTITLHGADDAGERVAHKIDCHYPSNWARMFAAHLDAIKLGDLIGVAIWPNRDNDKISNCKVERGIPFGDGEFNWVAIARRTDAPRYDMDGLARELAGLDPREKDARREEYSNEHRKKVAAWMRPIIESHPGYEGDDPAPIPEEDPDAYERDARNMVETAERVFGEPGPTEAARNQVRGDDNPFADEPDNSANAHEKGRAVLLSDLAAFSAWGIVLPESFGVSAAQCATSADRFGKEWTKFENVCSAAGISADDIPLVVRAALRELKFDPSRIVKDSDVTEADMIVTAHFVHRATKNGSIAPRNAVQRERRPHAEDEARAEAKNARGRDAGDEYDPFRDE